MVVMMMRDEERGERRVGESGSSGGDIHMRQTLH